MNRRWNHESAPTGPGLFHAPLRPGPGLQPPAHPQSDSPEHLQPAPYTIINPADQLQITVGNGAWGGWRKSDGYQGNPSYLIYNESVLFGANGGFGGERGSKDDPGSGGTGYYNNGGNGGDDNGDWGDSGQGSWPGAGGAPRNDAGGGGGGASGYYTQVKISGDGEDRGSSAASPGIGGQGYGAGGGGGGGGTDKKEGGYGGYGSSGLVAFRVNYHDDTAPGLVAYVGDQSWTNVPKVPIINWSEPVDTGGSGVSEYEIYWGTNPSGTTPATIQSGRAYVAPDCTTTAKYYLRIRAKDRHDNYGGWNTVYVYDYDKTTPGITTTYQVQDWTNDPNNSGIPFSWSAAIDAHSGIDKYQIYWGQNPQGVGTEWVAGNDRNYSINCAESTNNYYLRVRAIDRADNMGDWKTVLLYRYDDISPDQPTVNIVSEWTSVADALPFDWYSDIDYGGSGVDHYRYYWGIDPEGTAADTQISTVFDPPACTESRMHYLRVQVVDRAGNASDWKTVYTYRYDSLAPANSVTSVSEGPTNERDRDPFDWEASDDGLHGSGVSYYNIYWGKDSSGTSTDQQTLATFDPPEITDPGIATYIILITMPQIR